MKLSTIISLFIVVGTSSVINAELRGFTKFSQHRMAKQDKSTTAPSAAVGSKGSKTSSVKVKTSSVKVKTSSVKVKTSSAKTKKVPSEKVADAKAEKVAVPQKIVSTTDIIKTADAKAEKAASPSKSSKTTPKTMIAGKSSKGSKPKKSSKSVKVSKSSKTQTAAPSADPLTNVPSADPLTSVPSADTLDTITIDSESEAGIAGAFTERINIANILLSDDEFSSMSMSMSL